jgi:hypothetical protein
MSLGHPSLNHTQQLVLSFFVFAWSALVVILVVAPEVYEEALQLPGGERELSAAGFLAAISGFLMLLGIGVVRRWRWTFWLVLVAFILGVLRVPASALQLAGLLSPQGPVWYMLLQGFIGLVQFAIGLAMLAGYRRAGVWGSL